MCTVLFHGSVGCYDPGKRCEKLDLLLSLSPNSDCDVCVKQTGVTAFDTGNTHFFFQVNCQSLQILVHFPS